MKTIFTISALFFFHLSLSQNLVNNWSFEDTVSCPFYLGQIDKSVGWDSYKESPDYFNSCNVTFVGVPLNDVDYQLAHSGNAYAGVVTFASFTINAREFMGSQLNQSLIVGQKYFISLYVCAAYNPLKLIYLTSNKIGLRFSMTPFSYTKPAPVNNFAHVYSNSIITDTLNWTKISGSFISDSAYSYFAIGNFFDDTNTSVNNLDTNIFQEYSYYFVDDIKVSTDSAFVNTGIKTYSNNSIRIFPNPARDWIVMEGKGIKSVVILNALGSEIGYYPTTASTLHNQINFGNLSCGVYLVKINMIDNTFQIQKLLVQ